MPLRSSKFTSTHMYDIDSTGQTYGTVKRVVASLQGSLQVEKLSLAGSQRAWRVY